MGYAKHVGRVGALALALGIGAAVATTPGVAWAEGPEDGAPSPPPASQSADDGGSSDPTAPSSTRHDPGLLIRRSIERTTDNIRKVATGGVQSSGGAITSTKRNGASSSSGSGSPALNIKEQAEDPQSAKDVQKSTPTVANNESDTLRRFVAPRWHVPQVQRDMKPSQGPGAKMVDDVETSIQHTITTVSENHTRPPATTVDRTAISKVDAPSTLDERTPFVAPIKLVTNVLTTALAPFLNPTPGQPAPQNPVLWAVLGWVRRQFQDTPFGKIVLNRTPEITTPDVVDNHDGTFTITPSADDVDPDGDDLTYTASNGTDGTVVKNSDGTFTYTVDATNWDKSDTITLTASDEGAYPHIHGLAGIFSPQGGHTDSVTVTIAPSDGSLPPPPDVVQQPKQRDDGSGLFDTVLQYDPTTTSKVSAAPGFEPKYWTVVSEEYNSKTGQYTAVLKPTQAGMLRAGLRLDTTDDLKLQVTPQATGQTFALRAASFATAEAVDPPDQALTLPTPPAAHLEVTNPGIPVGGNPAGVVITDKYAYVANEQDGTVTVIDVNRDDDVDPLNPTFNTVVETIPVGSQPFFAGLSKDRLYVVGADTVSIVNTTTNQTVDTIPVAPKFSLISIPTNALVSPDAQKLYLLNANDGNVYVIDVDPTHLPDGDPATPEYKSVTPIPLGSGFTYDVDTRTYTIDFPISGGFNADGTRLYIVHESIETQDTASFTFHDGELVVIDTTTDTVVGDPVELGQFGGYAASDGRYLYVPTFDSAELSAAYPEGSPLGYVTVVDISSDPDHPTVVDLNGSAPGVGRLHGGALPLNVASSPDGSLAYVVNAGDGTITVIDTVDNEVLDLDPKTTGAQGIQFTQTPADDIYIKNVIGSTPDGTRLYVTNYTTNTVTALEIVDGLAPEAV
jgi:DNA-binding beta-propeller fold protein YncE